MCVDDDVGQSRSSQNAHNLPASSFIDGPDDAMAETPYSSGEVNGCRYGQRGDASDDSLRYQASDVYRLSARRAAEP